MGFVPRPADIRPFVVRNPQLGPVCERAGPVDAPSDPLDPTTEKKAGKVDFSDQVTPYLRNKGLTVFFACSPALCLQRA